MSNVVFPFTLSRPYAERRVTSTAGRQLGGGLVVVRDEFGSPGWRFMASFKVSLPRGGQTVDTWDDFVEARLGADTFLFMAHRTQNKTVTAEAVGTGDAVETVFALDKKHIDASSLVVYLGSTQQTGGGTDYTFSGNNTAPIVTFNSPPGGSVAVTADYNFYFPVIFADDDMPVELRAGGTTSATIRHDISVRVMELYPGAHLV